MRTLRDRIPRRIGGWSLIYCIKIEAPEKSLKTKKSYIYTSRFVNSLFFITWIVKFLITAINTTEGCYFIMSKNGTLLNKFYIYWVVLSERQKKGLTTTITIKLNLKKKRKICKVKRVVIIQQSDPIKL